MFNKDITNSDMFIDMPLSSHALYFHLWMNADDDWFVSHKWLMRLIQAKDDDLKMLIAKWFVINFQNSVIVITHRKKNNLIRSDRYTPTMYKKHLETLGLTNGAYQVSDKTPTNGMPSIGEGSIGEGSIEKYSIVEVSEVNKPVLTIKKEKLINHNNDYLILLEGWNAEKITIHKKLTNNAKEKIKSRLREYTVEEIQTAIKNYWSIFKSDKTFFKYKWTFEEFLSRANWMPVFLYKLIDDYLIDKWDVLPKTEHERIKEFERLSKDWGAEFKLKYWKDKYNEIKKIYRNMGIDAVLQENKKQW